MTAQRLSHADRFEWQRNVLANAELTATQKNILIRLALHLNIQTGRCDPSVRTLAKGAGVAERTVQIALAAAETLGCIRRNIGGGRGNTNAYDLLTQPTERVNADAPFEERVHGDARKGAPDGQKPRTAVHQNIENKEKNSETYIHAEFEEWYRLYPRHEAKREAIRAYKQALSRGAATKDLKLGAMRYAAARQGELPRFTKFPATWLNADCWRDEPANGGEAHAADEVRADLTARSRAAAPGALIAGMAAALSERPDSRLFDPDDSGRIRVERRAAGGRTKSR
jgi:hypothetical protein